MKSEQKNVNSSRDLEESSFLSSFFSKKVWNNFFFSNFQSNNRFFFNESTFLLNCDNFSSIIN